MKTKLAFVALFGMLAGCGGGNTVYYEVIVGASVAGADCNPNTTPTKVVNDTTFSGASTMALITGTDNKVYLDIGKLTLEGTNDGKTGTFSGQDLTVDTATTGATKTSGKKYTITTTIDGSNVSGTYTEVFVSTCATSTNACGGTWKDISCTSTATFKGRQVKDVQMFHGI